MLLYVEHCLYIVYGFVGGGWVARDCDNHRYRPDGVCVVSLEAVIVRFQVATSFRGLLFYLL